MESFYFMNNYKQNMFFYKNNTTQALINT